MQDKKSKEENLMKFYLFGSESPNILFSLSKHIAIWTISWNLVFEMIT